MTPTTTVSYFTTTSLITLPGETNSLFTRPGKTITIPLPTCSPTIQPDSNGHVPPGSCNALWNYDPSFPAAVLFAILFAAVTLAHIVQATRYKKKWCWVVVVAAAWETLAYVFRAVSARMQQSSGVLLVHQIFVLTGPLWINAFAYVVLGRMIHFFVPSHRIYRVPAPVFAAIFVALDITCFVVQLVGGGMVSPTASVQQKLRGIRVYMAGIGMQQAFIVLFASLAVGFQRKMQGIGRGRGDFDGDWRGWKRILCVVYASLGLITIRIIYRLVEFSSGSTENNAIANQEAYSYVLDAVPMLFALLVFNIFHPGAVLDGPGAEMPGLWMTLRDLRGGWTRHRDLKMSTLS